MIGNPASSPRLMAWTLAAAAVLVIPSAGHAKKKPATPRPTVVVAPFHTAADGPEYQWLGTALSEALTERLIDSGEANVFSQKQWAAVLRERDIAAREVVSEQDAEAIARQLGADEFVFGRYQARWPQLMIQAKRIKVGQAEPVATAQVEGTLDKAQDLEKKLAKALFDKDFKKAVKAKPSTGKGDSWRLSTLCAERLALQSLGPQAQPWLPTTLVEQALADCGAALKADKKNDNATAFEALALWLTGDAKNQKKALGQIKKLTKGKKRPYGWPDQIAYFLLRQSGDDEGAKKVLVAAIKAKPGLLHTRTTLGEDLALRGDSAGAQKVFEESLEVAPRQPWVLVQVGKLKAKQGDVAGGLASTEEALKLVPDDAVYLMEKASRHIDGKQWKEAEATLREAMAHDPRLAAAYLRLGYVYLETNQLELAAPILKKALYEADRPSEKRVRGYAHYDLAKLHARLGDPDRAIDDLGKAVREGFSDRARFESDPDLVDVVKMEAYQKLMGPAPAEAPPGAKPTGAKPDVSTPIRAFAGDAKPADAKPADAKPADAKPADAKPADAKPGAAAPPG